MIKEDIKRYFELQEQMEVLKNEMTTLKTQIVDDMDTLGVSNYDTDNVKAQIVNKETIKYNDELAIIKYLKDNGLSRFVVEKIDTTSMNKEIKNSATLNESLSSYITKSVAPTLIVKEIK